MVGRTVLVNKHPFTILGVAPPGFRGTLLLFSPDFFVPIVNQEQVDGEGYLNARGKRRVLEMIGHLKPGVTPAQAIADLNSVGSYLEKTYPKDDSKMSFVLVRPGLGGEFSWTSDRGIPNRVDAAGGVDSAGRMRQSGQPVCRTRR